MLPHHIGSGGAHFSTSGIRPEIRDTDRNGPVTITFRDGVELNPPETLLNICADAGQKGTNFDRRKRAPDPDWGYGSKASAIPV